MISTIQLPLTLLPGRRRVVAFLLICSLFVIGGVWLIQEGELIGYFFAGFFALGLPVLALQFHPKAAYLHLAPDGFTFCTLFRAHTVCWSHVRGFAVTYLGLNRTVAWNFTADYPATERARGISKALCGYEAALPDTYGMDPQELANLMESLRQRYAETTRNI